MTLRFSHCETIFRPLTDHPPRFTFPPDCRPHQTAARTEKPGGARMADIHQVNELISIERQGDIALIVNVGSGLQVGAATYTF